MLGAIPLRKGVAQGFEGVTSVGIRLLGYPSWNRQLEVSVMFRNVDLEPGTLALEVGCGTAPLSGELAFWGVRIVGMDIDCSRIAIAHGRYAKKNAEFVVADASRLPFRRNVFDAILSLSAMEHFVDIEGFLSASYECLKSGGYLLVITDGEPLPISNSWLRLPAFLLKKDVRELVKTCVSLDQVALISHRCQYKVRRYFSCEDVPKFESAGFQITECEPFMGGPWACLFQAYVLIAGLTFENGFHRFISILLNPFVHLANTGAHGVSIYLKGIKE